MYNHATRQWIGLVHPDLGIGGAERLIVDIALELARNDRVMLYTAHHDTKHCFKETLLEGERVHWIQERGNFIPTSIFGFCHVLCSNLRSAWASLRMLFELGSPKTVIIDQVLKVHSTDTLFDCLMKAIMPVLIFRLFSKAQVIFYCHFPDKLLTRRSSILRRLYRLPFDALEGLAMKSAHHVLVNSKFTAAAYAAAFHGWTRRPPALLYPSVRLNKCKTSARDFDSIRAGSFFLSINRFERKKRLHIAIHAFKSLRVQLSSRETEAPYLILGGGYDARMQENVKYYVELQR